MFRWNTIIGLLYATGARTEEIRELRIKDVSGDARGRTTFSIRGKWARQVAVHSRAAELLRRFVGPGRHRPDRRIFEVEGKPLRGDALRRELAERSRRLGLLSIVRPLDLQTACIRDLLNSGMAPERVAQQIGIEVRSVMRRMDKH